MSKCKFLLSLVLSFLLLFGSFSVGAYATENENLISSNLQNWYLGSDLAEGYVDPDHFIYNAETNTTRIRVRFPSHEDLDYFGVTLLYELPEIQVGQNYQYEFTIAPADVVSIISPHLNDKISAAFGVGVTMVFGIGYIDSDNFLNFDINHGYSIDYSDFPEVIGQTFKESFRLDNIKGTPVLAIMLTSVGSSESIVFLQNVSLTKVENSTDKKLDGILGWLQELWNSITGGFDRIQTKIGEVITNLSGALTDVWQRITSKLEQIKDNLVGEIQQSWQNINIKLGEVISGLTGELRKLGDNIINSIRNFFIPSDDYFDSLSISFRDIAEDRFGALFTVVDFIDSFLFSFDADKTTEYIDIPVYQFDIFGYTFPFGGWRFRFIPDYPIIHQLVDIAKGVSNIIITFTFIGGLKSRYDEIFGG